MTDLPRPIHFIPETPELDRMRFQIAMPDPQVTPVRSCGMITVLYMPSRLVRTSSAKIDPEHRLDICRKAPINELIRSKLVSLCAQPGNVQTRLALLHRPYSIFPVISRKEISTWISYDCRPQFTDQIQYIVPESVFVCSGMSRFEDAGVNTTSHMFDEGAEEATVKFSDRKVGIEDDSSVLHGGAKR
jgi:hypothetical protein